jgi:hypothetical protein
MGYLLDRDMAPLLGLSPTSMKRGSSGEHIIHRQHHITRVPGRWASYDPLHSRSNGHSRLTALELKTLQIPSTMIVDTMVGSLFQHHDVHAVGVSRCHTPCSLVHYLSASCGSRPDSREWGHSQQGKVAFVLWLTSSHSIMRIDRHV